jgi:hypothetical protein
VIERAFSVESPGYSFGLVRADHHWDVEGGQLDGRGLNGAVASAVEENDLAHALSGTAERP